MLRSSSLGIRGLIALLAGAILVGVAIVVDGPVGRLINGAGGILWFTSAAILTGAAVRSRPPRWLWGVLALLTVTVAFIVKPSAALPAVIGFAGTGFIMGLLVPESRMVWAALVPAWYLPAHIGTAVAMSVLDSLVGNEASLRTDPPPTAAMVPMLMVLCALLGGLIASRIRGGSSFNRFVHHSVVREG